jgi:hypothetical protein
MLAITLSACVKTATFYPIEGPMSAVRPVPELKARATGILGTKGDLTLVLPDGEVCTGRWGVASAGDNVRRGHAVLYGNAGTIIEVEFNAGTNAEGTGTARDNKGNIYRVIF